MQRLSGYLLLVLATLSWSTTGLFVRVVGTDIPTTLFWKSCLGGLCLLVFYFIAKGGLGGKFGLKQALTFNFGEYFTAALMALGAGFFVAAFYFTTIANVSFAYGIVPLVTYGLSCIFLKESLRWVSLFCCGLALTGVTIIFGGNLDVGHVTGISLGLLTTFAFAAFTVSAKYFGTIDAAKVTYLGAFMLAVAVLPFASYNIAAVDFGWLVGYGFVDIFLGFGAYIYGVKRCAVLVASLIGLCEIILAPAWAWLLFAEAINQGTFLGGVFIISAALVYIFRGNK